MSEQEKKDNPTTQANHNASPFEVSPRVVTSTVASTSEMYIKYSKMINILAMRCPMQYRAICPNLPIEVESTQMW